MSDKPRLLFIADSPQVAEGLLAQVAGAYEVTVVADLGQAMSLLSREQFDGVFVADAFVKDALPVEGLLRDAQILEGMRDAVILLDASDRIVWENRRLSDWFPEHGGPGQNFYTVLGDPEILGPDFCPMRAALATGQDTTTTLQCEDKYFQVYVTPLQGGDGRAHHLIVTLRDVTDEVHQQQKLAAIHQAGTELANLSPMELLSMSARERIELLKGNIIRYTKDLLHFETVEIRLLDQSTKRLDPLLAVEMEPEAASRELYAFPQNNGVTGFVAATGKSYLCEDTSEDPLFLEGVRGAKSSLTVPLILHDEVIGTFNVESCEPKAFSESDLQFLEVFGRNVAVALNTLELLVAEKFEAAQRSVEAIHSAVAVPVDAILSDAVNVMEQYIGHNAEVVTRLQQILKNARDIKQLIQRVGEKLAPAEAHPQSLVQPDRPLLRGKHILVVDADEKVRSASHDLLERSGCFVETAREGREALGMARNLAYHLVLADKLLPDMSAYDLMQQLGPRFAPAPVPLVLLTELGWDKEHIVVKCRQAGLPPNMVLAKPFRLDQLLLTVENAIKVYGPNNGT